MAAQGLCPRNSNVELPSPFRGSGALPSINRSKTTIVFGMPNIAEADGTIPPS
jgi:hypothetical protein